VGEDLSSTIADWKKKFAPVYATALQKNIPVYAVTAVRDATMTALSETAFAAVPVFSCDNVTIRSAARTNPCIYIIQNGTIIQKQSYKRMNKIADALQSLSAQPAPKMENNSPGTDTVNQRPGTGNK
jgi:hypothetical protein